MFSNGVKQLGHKLISTANYVRKLMYIWSAIYSIILMSIEVLLCQPVTSVTEKAQ